MSGPDPSTSVAGPPCAGLRVVELGGGMAGPMAGGVLADYGADVIKVEPPEGDWARPFPGFHVWNRGKRSVAADLRRADDVAEVRRLVAAADVVIDATADGVAEGCGLDPGRLVAENPALVHCRIGAGTEELSAVGAYEAVVAAAAGRMLGLDAVSGRAEGVQGGRPV